MSSIRQFNCNDSVGQLGFQILLYYILPMNLFMTLHFCKEYMYGVDNIILMP